MEVWNEASSELEAYSDAVAPLIRSGWILDTERRGDQLTIIAMRGGERMTIESTIEERADAGAKLVEEVRAIGGINDAA